MSLDSKKATSGSISPKILKMSANICSFALKNCFNTCVELTKFPQNLKRGSITPVLKSGDSLCVENYRPIGILPTVSKLFEKLIAEQLTPFLENCFSELLCGFRKGHHTRCYAPSTSPLAKSFGRFEHCGDCINWTYRRLTIVYLMSYS